MQTVHTGSPYAQFAYGDPIYIRETEPVCTLVLPVYKLGPNLHDVMLHAYCHPKHAAGLHEREGGRGGGLGGGTSSLKDLPVPAMPLNSRPLSDCNSDGAPIVVKMSSRAAATAAPRLLVKGLQS